MKKFPKKLFLKIDGDKGEEYFVADDKLYGLAEMGEKIKVGVYTLTETQVAECVISTKKSRSR